MRRHRTVVIVTIALVTLPALPAVQDQSTPPPAPGFATQKLAPHELGEFDRFGHDIAIDDGRAAISIADDPGVGAIAIYEREDGTWTKTDWITPPEQLLEDPRLGSSLVLDGDHLLAGASGVDAGGTATGAAVLFDHTEDAWTVDQVFYPLNPTSLNAFGRAVAMDGDTIAISEPEADLDDDYDRDGLVHVYEQEGDGYTHAATVTPPDDESGERLGVSLALEGDTLVAGGPDDDADSGTGAVYVYQDDGSTWTQTARLTAPAEDAPRQLGRSIDIQGDVIVAGAPGPQVTTCCGLLPPTPPGQAHVFENGADGWSHADRLTPATDPVPGAGFGLGVALHEGTAYAGAPNAPFDDHVGTLHTFESADEAWTETGIALSEDPGQGTALEPRSPPPTAKCSRPNPATRSRASTPEPCTWSRTSARIQRARSPRPRPRDAADKALTPARCAPAMPFDIVIAAGTGTWTALGVLGGFTLVGLTALGLTKGSTTTPTRSTRYVMGVGKHPRLVELPENRDIPATNVRLGSEGVKQLASKSSKTDAFTPDVYERADRTRSPYELSDDLPDDTRKIVFDREEGTLTVDDNGDVIAAPKLTTDERHALEEMIFEVLDEGQARADLRTWSHTTEDTETINAKRV
jgi:hypothetical protein